MNPRSTSPLLSSLGMMALASAAAAPACRDDDGRQAPIEDINDVFDVEEDAVQFYCQCYGELYGLGPMGVEDCLSELDVNSDEELACLTGVFDANPAEFEVLRCQAEAQRDLLSCQRADGCPPTFTCDGGAQIPEDFVCDGEDDCEDGSDEQQNCPAPFMCEDGTPQPNYALCDGFEDCEGAEDESDCPAPFTCGDGNELPADWVCDGERDCADGTDEEQNCPVTCSSRAIRKFEDCGQLSAAVQNEAARCYPFGCFDGQELAVGQRCDGTPDCEGGEDEEGCDPPESTGGEGGESTGG